MKTLQFAIAVLITMALPLSAADPETPQEQLARVEIEYAMATSTGSGLDTAKIQNLKTKLEALGEIPGVRNKVYWKLLNDKKIKLEACLARLTSEGLGQSHPQIQNVKAEIAAIESIQNDKS